MTISLAKSKYYSLDDSYSKRRKGVRVLTLKADLQRGVKRLPEYAYSKQWGSTSGSLRFFNVLMKYIDVTKVNRAKLKHSLPHHFTMELYHPEGFTIVLKGVSGGYFGEGSRGCHDVLLACGFNQVQANKAFSHEQFEVRK